MSASERMAGLVEAYDIATIASEDAPPGQGSRLRDEHIKARAALLAAIADIEAAAAAFASCNRARRAAEDECEWLRDRNAAMSEALATLGARGFLDCITSPACGACTCCDARAILENP